ncbi:hypothetical protein MAR_002424 [Mya arenaria]|uniref:Uncharacterized protein n=1 Tax=Mya arenaria TaxID=6604 RepID=A0ABY7FIK7_MYAAR|nr:hypothetical protein MAR_002424 [Mya arenaria]
MSRRASLFAKQNPEEKKPKCVRFPDELVFLDNIKENDVHALGSMLRRASLQVDISAINDAGGFLLESGADKNILTDEGERPLDLVEPSDLPTIRVMLSDAKPNTENQSEDELDDDVTDTDVTR